MSTSNLPSDPPNSEELVAYLDGEMPPDDCRRVERQLSSDANYRRELAELDQAWSALDELPHTAAANDFARTTIEMVAVAAERDQAEQSTALASGGRYRVALLGAVCAVVAAVGYASALALVPNSNDALIDDLSVIAQIDVLTEIGDIEFLRGLSKLELARPIEDEGSSAAEIELRVPVAGWGTLDDRRAWIEQLSADSQAELAVKLARFNNLSSDAERSLLRTLERDITLADDSTKLQKTLATYSTWIRKRTPGERMTLRELPSSEERIREVEQMAQRRDRFPRRQLSTADEKALQEAILDFVERWRRERMRENGRPGNRDFQRRLEGRSMAFVALAIVNYGIPDDGNRERMQEDLISRLSPETQDYIDSLSRHQRRWQLWQWCRDALDPRYGPQELEIFFVEQLDNDQREVLLGLPQTEMEEKLERMYVGSQTGLRGRNWPGGEGPGRLEQGGTGPPGPRGNRDRGLRDRGDRGPQNEFNGDGLRRYPPDRPRPPPEFDNS